MLPIAVAGHVCADIRPQLGPTAALDPGKLLEVGPVTITLGGTVANTGRALAALGAPVTLYSCVGDDVLGRLVQAELAADPRLASSTEVVPGVSTSYSLILEPVGVDRTIWHNVGANAAFSGGGIDLDGSDLFHLGYPPLLPGLLVDDGRPLAELLTVAKRAGVTTSVDLAVVDPASSSARLDWTRILSRMTAQTDVLSPSLDDLTSALGRTEPYSSDLAVRVVEQLIDWGAAVVVLSAGEHGLFVRTAGRDRLAGAGRALRPQADVWADQSFHLPPLWTGPPVTTNGAGDAASAGLLYGIATGAGPVTATRLAAACAAVVVGGGAISLETVQGLAPELVDIVAPH